MAEKVIKASNTDEVLDMMYDILGEIGFEDVIILASAGKDKYASLIKGTTVKKTIAQLGMAIKEVSLELDMPSNELADEISDNLKHAEEAFAKLQSEKKEKKSKKIDIVVNN